MLRSQHVRAVFRAQVCAPRDGEVVREAELSECGGEGCAVWEYCGGGECGGGVWWYVFFFFFFRRVEMVRLDEMDCAEWNGTRW